MPIADANTSKVSSASSDPGKTKSNSKKKGNGGGADFDETKVKRDGFGKFSKKSIDGDPSDPDATWRNSVSDKLDKAFMHDERIVNRSIAVLKQLAREHGISEEEMMRKPNIPVMVEYGHRIVPILNSLLSEKPELRFSPSGKERVESYFIEPTPAHKYGQVELRAVNVKTGKVTKAPLIQHHVPSITHTAIVKQQVTVKKNVAEFNDYLAHAMAEKNIIKANIAEFNDYLAHAKGEQTIQDLLNNRTEAQADVMELVIGAAVDNQDMASAPQLTADYLALPVELQYLTEFVIGNALAEDSFLHAQARVDKFLEHSGVKGMKWGVRNAESEARFLSTSSLNTKENRAAARVAVKYGSATLEQKHVAALKSTGHRTLNAFTGDKTFWKRTAKVAGIAAIGVGVSLAAPVVLPSSTLASIGAFVAHQAGYSVVAGQAIGIGADGVIYTSAVTAMGKAAAVAAGLSATGAGAGLATAVNATTNVARAVTGNARVDRSYAALGQTLVARQTAGADRIRKVLNRESARG